MIEDDGAGFDAAEFIRLERLGGLSLEEWARMVDGSLTAESHPCGGTTSTPRSRCTTARRIRLGASLSYALT